MDLDPNPDPDQSEPYVFGPPGSGDGILKSGVWIRLRIQILIFLSSSKNSKKNLDSYCFVTFFDFENG